MPVAARIIKLLGIPSVVEGDYEQALPLEHPLFLLTYLNAHEAWIPRSEILGLLFEADEEAVARNKLRQLLFRAKKQPWFDGLEANPQYLKHTAQTDLNAFRKAIEIGNWEAAVANYGGQLLQDTPVSALARFEDWLDQERADLEARYLEAAMWLANSHTKNQDFAQASELLMSVLSKDPLSEEAMQAYLAVARLTEQKGEAVQRYERFKTQLAHELNMKPLPETIAQANLLIEALNQETLQSLRPNKDLAPPTPDLLNAPKGLSPFVGRDPELAHLIGLLEQDPTQLVSLLGIGGIGKTRLALAVASDVAKRQKHGGVFVALASVSSSVFFADALIKALGLEPDTKLDSITQVIGYLKDKSMLILLDNFEHLMDARLLIQELMAEATNIKILLTSRERLNLSQEQVFEVTGLALPESFDEHLPLEAYDGIALFLRAARKNQARFSLTPEKRKDIFALCQTLEGVPLALELAASWLRLMTVGEILAEARKSFDLIESEFADLPSRHQSLRAVFESSWKLLHTDEQRLLVALSVFTGGFTLEAARWIADASPRSLLKLVNKSLIRRDQSGRFEFLEIVRQFAFEKLLADPILAKDITDRHADFYASMGKTAEPYLTGGSEQLSWLNQLELDHANLRKALSHLLKPSTASLALDLANHLFHYWLIRGHWHEAKQIAAQLLNLSEALKDGSAKAKLLAHTAYLDTLQGQFKNATDWIKQSLGLYRKTNNLVGLAEALCYAGINCIYQDRYAEADSYYLESLALVNSTHEPLINALVLHELGNAALRQDHLAEAKQFYLEALSLRERAQDARGSARTLNNLGIVARRQGDYLTAEKSYRQSLSLSRSLGDRLGLADSLNALGVLLKAQGRYEEARTAYEESLGIYTTCGDRLGEAVILENLGTLARLEHNYADAKTFYEACLANHKNREDNWGITKALNGLALAQFKLGAVDLSLEYLKTGHKLAIELSNPQLLSQNQLALAYVLSFTQHLELATRILAQVKQALELQGIVLTPIEQDQVLETEKRLKAKLPKQSFAEFWQTAKTLQQDELSQTLERLLSLNSDLDQTDVFSK